MVGAGGEERLLPQHRALRTIVAEGKCKVRVDGTAVEGGACCRHPAALRVVVEHFLRGCPTLWPDGRCLQLAGFRAVVSGRPVHRTPPIGVAPHQLQLQLPRPRPGERTAARPYLLPIGLVERGDEKVLKPPHAHVIGRCARHEEA